MVYSVQRVGMGRKAYGPVCCVTYVQKNGALIV